MSVTFNSKVLALKTQVAPAHLNAQEFTDQTS